MVSVVYTTVSLMLVTLPAISSRTNATSADLAVFAERAETVINAKIAKFYSLPFTDRIPILETIATDIACYYFLTRRVFTQERDNESSWPDKFKESMGLLDEIVDGRIPLLTSSGALLPVNTSVIEVWSNNMGYRPTMTEDDARNQFIDRDKIQDIRDDREYSA